MAEGRHGARREERRLCDRNRTRPRRHRNQAVCAPQRREGRSLERDGMNQGGEAIGRDLRLDACRGIVLWFIFLDHIPDNVGSWLTLRHYGFSDAAEVFM